MKKILNAMLSMSLIAAVSAPSTVAFAADGQHACSCVSAAGGSFGKVTSVSGEVLQAGKSGYLQASEGASLSAGTILSVGANSAANVSFGPSCSLSVPANSELLVTRKNSNAPLCATLKSTDEKHALKKTFGSHKVSFGADLPQSVENQVFEPTPAEESSFPYGLALVGAVVAGAAIYGIVELVDDDDDAPGADPATP